MSPLPAFRNVATPALTLLGLLAAAAVVALLVPGASAQARGTGQEIFQDPIDGFVGTLDFVRMGGTSTGSSVHFWLAMEMISANGVPRSPVLTDYQASPDPGYFVKFQVGSGLCYGALPRNTIGTNAWYSTSNAGPIAPSVGVTDCAPQNPALSGTGSFNLQPINVSWACNEVHMEIPFASIGGTPPAGTVFTILDVTSRGNGGFYDQSPLVTPPATTTYTLGAQGPDPNPGGLTATYVASPAPGVQLTWTAPLGGNTVTGYRIERRPLPPFGPLATIATIGPSPAPAASYLDTAALAPGDYEYRVTALRCDDPAPNQFILGGQVNAQVNVPDDTPPPVITANFLPGTSHASCENSAIPFLDLSATPDGPLTAWAWDFGDASTSTEQDPVHVYALPGVYPVTLTVTDSANNQDSASMDVPSIGDPNCCPVLSPLMDLVVDAGRTLTFTVQAADFEHDPIAFDVVGRGQTIPAHAMDAATGAFAWQTGLEDGGVYRARATASDAGCTAYDDLTLTVMPVHAFATDADQDGIPDVVDACAHVADNDQSDIDHDGVGDACDPTPCGAAAVGGLGDCSAARGPAAAKALTARDGDRDGVPDVADDCPQAANHAQADIDGDGAGDACDIDIDGDGIANGADNCALAANPDQRDADGDGVGDRCGGAGAEGAAGLPRAGGSQGAADGAQPAGALAAQMPRMGLGALAFALVVAGVLFAVSRLKR